MLLRQGPILFRKHHRPMRRASGATPLAALALVSAAYTPGENVELTFSRAVDIGAIDVGAFAVNDGAEMGFHYVGASASLTGPSVVQVILTGTTESSDPVTTLTATAANGIVADGDGAAWAGATDLALPFP
jgi:hypothetical protein